MPDADDDLLDDLPPLADDALGDEERLDGDELGLDSLIDAGDDEDVGLDDSAGLLEEESLYALELPPAEEGAGEDVDVIPIEGLDAGDEYGWVDDGASEEPWDAGDDLPSLVPLGRDDGGEEGVDDDLDMNLGGAGGDDSVPGLPPLDRTLADDDADEELDLAAFDLALPAPEGSSSDVATVDVRHLGPRDDDVRCIADPPRLAGGTGLYSVGPRCEPAGLAAHRVVSIAADGPGGSVVLGTAFDGVLRSDDGDAFERVEGFAEGGAWVARERGGRLWGRSESGGLYRSLDDGRTWTGPLLLKPVVALATPSDGGVVVLCAGRDAPPQLARSTDGGERWAALDGPPVSLAHEGAEWCIAVLGENVAVAADLDPTRAWVSDDAGRTWSAAPRPQRGTSALALVEEGPDTALYIASDRAVSRVIAAEEGVTEEVVLDVRAEAAALGIEPRGDGDGEARVHGIVAAPVAGTTILWVASGVGLFRVDVHWDGAEDAAP